MQSDLGAFARKDGDAGGFTGNRLYRSGTLAAVAKLADVLEFHIGPKINEPTKVVAGQHIVYLFSKYPAN